MFCKFSFDPITSLLLKYSGIIYYRIILIHIIILNLPLSLLTKIIPEYYQYEIYDQ